MHTRRPSVPFDTEGNEITLKDLGIDITSTWEYNEVNIIRGYEGTAAEDYAKRYGFRFESLGKAPASVTGTVSSSGMIALIGGAALIIGMLLGVLFAKLAGKKSGDTASKS